MIQILKLELTKYPQGFTWSDDAKKWTNGNAETLHPINDPYYSSENMDYIEFTKCPDDLWSQYIQCSNYGNKQYNYICKLAKKKSYKVINVVNINIYI